MNFLQYHKIGSLLFDNINFYINIHFYFPFYINIHFYIHFLYIHFSSDAEEAPEVLGSVKSWMRVYKLKLNPDKTDVL